VKQKHVKKHKNIYRITVVGRLWESISKHSCTINDIISVVYRTTAADCGSRYQII